jgi:hypothetical protein
MAATTARAGNTTWSLVIAAIFAYALVAIAVEPLRINGDSALHIEAAERILDGGLPHVDAIDTNPPLIMYLTAVPTAVARALGSHPIPVFLVAVWLFTATATFASRHLLLGALRAREAIHAHLLGAGLALASCALLFSNEFGQREHLFIFGVFPFLIARFRSWEGIATPPAAAIVAGVAAGIAASIKPQLALIVIAPEVYWLLTRRDIRTLVRVEVMAAVTMAAVYLAYLLLWPGQREAFFGVWVPLLVRGFAAFNGTYESIILWHFADWRPAAIAILPFLLRARPEDSAWKLTRPLAIATVTAAAVYVLQRKGWTYHALPIHVLAYAVASLVIAQLFTPVDEATAPPALTTTIPARLLKAAAAGAIALAVIGAMVVIGPETRAHEDRIIANSAVAQRIAAETQPGDAVLVLSTSAWDPYPLLVQLRRRQASRALFAFPISLLYFGSTAGPDQPSPYPEDEARFLDDLKADMQTKQPQLVLIDTTKPCYGCPVGMSLPAYFERTGFVESSLAGYERSGNSDRFEVYRRRN